MTLTGWYFPSLQRHITRVPTSKGSTEDLRRFDTSGSNAASNGGARAPLSTNGDLPWPAGGAEPFSALIGASREPIERKRKSLILCGTSNAQQTALFYQCDLYVCMYVTYRIDFFVCFFCYLEFIYYLFWSKLLSFRNLEMGRANQIRPN